MNALISLASFLFLFFELFILHSKKIFLNIKYLSSFGFRASTKTIVTQSCDHGYMKNIIYSNFFLFDL